MVPSFDLPPQYEPGEVERRWSQQWERARSFEARVNAPAQPYVIVMPPPNVTAVLHMGHGLTCVIQDVLIRCARMRGREALYLPGTDHAGIATQNVVERQLAEEGKTRFDLGRDAFVERVWAFVRQTGSTIIEQLKIIGCSCDWTRARFTLDAEYSRAVREVFVRLWEAGLIYRGHRVIHWCSRCRTALSDEEAEFEEETGQLYYIRYPVDGGSTLTVATTRPETMLGDTAVAVHPDDARYRGLVGKTVRLPIVGLAIPIIADRTVDPAFGTGAVKVTPAHDANDFEIGARHDLGTPLILTEEGRLGEPAGGAGRVPPDLRGLDRFAARERIVARLGEAGLLAKVEPHRHAVRHCYRCDTVVEPRLSDQWFVAMKPLAEPALAAEQDGVIRLVPDRWTSTYREWLTNIRDWNISRQLWWGHRIPVYTCGQGHTWAARETPRDCPNCGATEITQDPDVLDTWFSSWLWPFATLGWPSRTDDLARFYPGDTLVTAPDILFFWVTRMIMAGTYCFPTGPLQDRVPFHTVYLHGVVRDTAHRKMSKSLGNGIDPLVVVERFGADALRWTCVANTALGQDVILDPADLETTFAPGRNFANKLWNIGRFVLAQLPAAPDAVDSGALTLADRWILSRLQTTIREVTTSFEQFRLDEGAKRCYDFVWKELADWYVEAVKPRLGQGELERRSPEQDAARWVLARCFDAALRLLHPVVPFITEELWQRLPGRTPGALLAVAPWPEPDLSFEDPVAEGRFDRVRQAIEKIRALRADYRVPPNARLAATVVTRGSDDPSAFTGERETIQRLAHLGSLTFDGESRKLGAHATFGDGSEVFVALEGAIDLGQECGRLSTERARLDAQLTGLAAKLANPNFVARAPAEVVARERTKEREWQVQRDVLDAKLKALGCS